MYFPKYQFSSNNHKLIHAFLFLSMLVVTTSAAQGQTKNHTGTSTQHGHVLKHGNEAYYALEILTAIGKTDGGENFLTTHYHGWLGTDENKLFVMGEVERLDHETETAEFWFLYSRKISEFWDLQFGWRHDTQPLSREHIVAGIHGLAPFFIETGLYASLSQDGDVNIKLHQYRDFLISNKLVLTPYLEIDASTKDVPERNIASGIGVGEFGMRLGYYASKKIVPYIDLRYEVDFGDSEVHGERHSHEDEHGENFILMLGFQLLL